MQKLEIIASLAVLMCGQVFWWRRRDNIFGYFQVGLFVASILVPVLGTRVLAETDPAIVSLYAKILMIGAVAYLVGLCYGGSLGKRGRIPRVIFTEQFHDVPRSLARHSRQIAVIALVALAASFALLGYTPLLASNRLLAKYGIGPYRAGFQRGAQLFHLAMSLASTMAAVILAFVFLRRRSIEVAILAALLFGLACTLSRGEALVGPLTFLVAWGVQRHWKPALLLGIVCFSFLGATLVNEILFAGPSVSSASFAERAAGSAPDVSDHLGFLNGYRLLGSERIGMKTIKAGYSLSLKKGQWDPSDYALRLRTGLTDVGELASGGVRLPASIWGYAAYGWTGVVAWSFVSGIFVGWGTAVLRRLLTDVERNAYPNQALNLILAWVFYNGTFGVVSQFYFPFRSDILSVGLAVVLCIRRTGAPSPEVQAGAERLA